MFYLFWTILNTILVLLFIVICFRATKLVREKLGLLAAILFVFGLFSFMSHPKDEKESENDRPKWSWEKENKDDSLAYHHQKHEKIVLEENIMFSINLTIERYTKDNTNKSIPFKAYSTVSGIFGSYQWKPASISISKAENDIDFQYDVSGTIETSLLGATIHYNHKNYNGIIKAE